jgi:hypothetical protein
MNFMTRESPTHVVLFGKIDGAQRRPLSAAFESVLRAHADDDGGVLFDSAYVVVSARRR